jgi:hypothetical protein
MSQALATEQPAKTRIAVRKEKRGSELAWRTAGKDAHDRLGEAVQRWSCYVGPDGAGSTRSEAVYHQMFAQKIRKALGINQKIPREQLTDVELLALCAVETALAALLIDGMARNLTRAEIKTRYAETIAEMAAPHAKAIALSR